MHHVFTMANHVTALLNGATDPDPSQHGMTTEEERASSSKPQVFCASGRLGPCSPVDHRRTHARLVLDYRPTDGSAKHALLRHCHLH